MLLLKTSSTYFNHRSKRRFCMNLQLFTKFFEYFKNERLHESVQNVIDGEFSSTFTLYRHVESLMYIAQLK